MSKSWTWFGAAPWAGWISALGGPPALADASPSLGLGDVQAWHPINYHYYPFFFFFFKPRIKIPLQLWRESLAGLLQMSVKLTPAAGSSERPFHGQANQVTWEVSVLSILLVLRYSAA